MFRIALAAILAIVIEATSLQSQIFDQNSMMREGCRELDEVACQNKVFCVWKFSGSGAHRRGRCHADDRFM